MAGTTPGAADQNLDQLDRGQSLSAHAVTNQMNLVAGIACVDELLQVFSDLKPGHLQSRGCFFHIAAVSEYRVIYYDNIPAATLQVSIPHSLNRFVFILLFESVRIDHRRHGMIETLVIEDCGEVLQLLYQAIS